MAPVVAVLLDGPHAAHTAEFEAWLGVTPKYIRLFPAFVSSPTLDEVRVALAVLRASLAKLRPHLTVVAGPLCATLERAGWRVRPQDVTPTWTLSKTDVAHARDVGIVRPSSHEFLTGAVVLLPVPLPYRMTGEELTRGMVVYKALVQDVAAAMPALESAERQCNVQSVGAATTKQLVQLGRCLYAPKDDGPGEFYLLDAALADASVILIVRRVADGLHAPQLVRIEGASFQFTTLDMPSMFAMEAMNNWSETDPRPVFLLGAAAPVVTFRISTTSLQRYRQLLHSARTHGARPADCSVGPLSQLMARSGWQIGGIVSLPWTDKPVAAADVRPVARIPMYCGSGGVAPVTTPFSEYAVRAIVEVVRRRDGEIVAVLLSASCGKHRTVNVCIAAQDVPCGAGGFDIVRVDGGGALASSLRLYMAHLAPDVLVTYGALDYTLEPLAELCARHHVPTPWSRYDADDVTSSAPSLARGSLVIDLMREATHGAYKDDGVLSLEAIARATGAIDASLDLAIPWADGDDVSPAFSRAFNRVAAMRAIADHRLYETTLELVRVLGCTPLSAFQEKRALARVRSFLAAYSEYNGIHIAIPDTTDDGSDLDEEEAHAARTRKRKRHVGGLIIAPPPGIYLNMATLDARSMYQSITVEFDVSCETLANMESDEERFARMDVRSPPSGFLSRAQHDLRQQRAMAQTSNPALSVALKLLGNMIYGVASLMNHHLGEFIAQSGRAIIRSVASVISETFGMDVCAVHTDSITCTSANWLDDASWADKAARVAQLVTDANDRRFEFRLESAHHAILWFGMQNYASLTLRKDGSYAFVAKGLSYMTSRAPPAVRDALEAMLTEILKQRKAAPSMEPAMAALRDAWERIASGKEDVHRLACIETTSVLWKQHHQSLLAAWTSPHSRAPKMAQTTRVVYVVSGVRSKRGVVPPEDFDRLCLEDPDAEWRVDTAHLVRQYFKPAISALFSSIGPENATCTLERFVQRALPGMDV